MLCGSEVALPRWWLGAVQSGEEGGRWLLRSLGSGKHSWMVSPVTQCAGEQQTPLARCVLLLVPKHIFCCVCWNESTECPKWGTGGKCNRTRTVQRGTLVPAHPVSVCSFFSASPEAKDEEVTRFWAMKHRQIPRGAAREALLCFFDTDMAPFSLISLPLFLPASFFYGGWGRGKNIDRSLQ